jgi:hypothetical protein
MRHDDDEATTRRARERMLAMWQKAMEAAQLVGASVHDARAIAADEAAEALEPAADEVCAFPAAEAEAR